MIHDWIQDCNLSTTNLLSFTKMKNPSEKVRPKNRPKFE